MLVSFTRHIAVNPARFYGVVAPPPGSPVERLVAVLFHPEVRRQRPITSPMERVGTAFGIALDENFADEELNSAGLATPGVERG